MPKGYHHLTYDQRLNLTEASKKINDYILFSQIGSFQDQKILKGLMHLGISKESYNADPIALAEGLFKGETFLQKTVEFEKLKKKHPADCLPALDHLYEKLAVAVLQNDGDQLRLLPNNVKTYQMCLAAVENFGPVLKFVPDSMKTPEMCMSAVQQYGFALLYVPQGERTLQLAKTLFKGRNFHEQTNQFQTLKNILPNACWPALDDLYRKLAMDALKKDGLSLMYIPEDIMTDELCLTAVKQNGMALKFVPVDKRTSQLYGIALEQDGLALQFIQFHELTPELCRVAVELDGLALQFIPLGKRTFELCRIAVEQNGLALRFFPLDKRTFELCKIAVEQNGLALQFVPLGKRTFELCRIAVEQNGLALEFVPDEIIKSQEFIVGFLQSFKGKDINNPEIKSLLEQFSKKLDLYPTILEGIPEQFKKIIMAVKKFPEEVSTKLQAFQNQESLIGCSWERLINEKLRNYVVAKKPHDFIALIEQTKKRLEERLPFLGTPQADKHDLLNAWYKHIQSILIKLDAVIDADPEKDTAEKENLLSVLGVCGGGWQAQFEQMQSKLITYPKGADFDAIVGKILTEKALEIVDSINLDYATVNNKYPNVHDQNKIKYLPKEYIGEQVLDDHLSELSWTKEQVLEKFLEIYNPKTITEAILSKIKEDDEVSERIVDYYQKELFVGCSSNPEFDAQIETERQILEEKLTTFASKKEQFNKLLELIAGIPDDKKEEFLNKLSSYASFPKSTFRNALKRDIKTPEGTELLSDEVSTTLAEKKDEIASLISYRREIARLAKVAGKTIFEKTVEELKEDFTANKQSKIEAFFVEQFEDNHVEDGVIKPSGVMLILEKMGFLVPMKVFDQDALGTIDSAAIAAEN